MEIQVDYRELENHPEIKFFFEVEEAFPIRTTLNIGDYYANGILFEHKTHEDLVKSVKEGLLFQQIADMNYNIDVQSYIFVSCSMHEITNMRSRGMSENELNNTIASIFERGVPILFCESIGNMVSIMVNLMKKHSDDNDRTVNPVRKPISQEEQMQLTYSTIPSVGQRLSERLYSEFPTLDKLMEAKLPQLVVVDGISKKKATTIYNYLHGIK